MVRQVNLNSYKKSLIHSCIALAVCQYPAAVFAEDATTQQQEKIFSIIKKIKQRYDQQEQAEKTYASAGKNSTPETPQSSSTSTVAAETFTTEDVTAEAGDRQNSDTVSSENNADGFDTTESTESESRFMEGEELLVELMVEGIQVNDILIVKSKQGFVVDLIALMQLLDFNLKISSTGNQLKGWYSKAANTFDITLPDKPNSAIQAKIKGKDYRVDSNSYQVIENLVYVELADIERWFEFSFKLEETELKLLLTTKEPLPIVLKKKRDSAQIANTRAETAVLPFRDEGYKAFSMPVFDMQANQQFYKFNKITTSNTSYSLVGSGDLSYLTSQFYLSGNKDNALADARLSLMRESNKNDLAGPLKLSSFELGDISPVNAGRDATQGQSLGIRASSLSSAESGDNQRVNLVGEIQDGWDIELYRNSILIDRRTGTTGGRYEFNDVELLFGDNNFEIIFYGPQGQIETREEKFSITGNSLASGDNSYAFSLSRNNSKLIDLDDSAQGDQDLFFSSIYRYGFTDWWTGRLGLTYLKPETASEVPQMTREDKRSINLGQNFALGRVLLGTDYYTDQRYTQSYNLDLRTALLGVNWGIGYQNSQYQKDIASEEKAENERLGFGMSGSIPLPIPVAYQNDYSLDKDDTGATITRIGNSLSIRTGYGYLSNSLQYLKSETATSITTNYGSHSSTGPTIGNTNGLNNGLNNEAETVVYNSNEAANGSLRYNTAFGRVFTGISAGYTIKPEPQLDTLRSNLSYSLSSAFSGTLQLIYDFNRKQTSGRVGIGWQGDSLALDSYFNYSKKDSYSAGINARFSFGYEKDTGQLFVDKRSLTSGGSMAVRVFEDKNLNEKYDNGEPLVNNVKVQAAQSYRNAKTNKYGVAILSGLQPGSVTDIVVDRSSFEDPFLIPSSEGISVKPRRGYLTSYDLPVSSTGEIEGKVFISEIDGTANPAAYINLSLVNSADEEVATSITEYDGYYVFSEVLPGQYRVMLDPSYAKRKKLRKAKSMAVKIHGDGEIFNAADVTLAQMEFKEGFAADLGQFSSLTMLKAYWALVKNTGMNTAKFLPFYVLNDAGKYDLKVAFYPDEQKVIDICARFNARKINCEVKQQGFDL